MNTLTIEQEDELIDNYDTSEFYSVMREEFGTGGVVKMLGYATLLALTLKSDPKEARETLVSLGWSEDGVYYMYREFRRLRRVLLARKGYAMQETGGGPGTNEGVFRVVAKVRRLEGLQTLTA